MHIRITHLLGRAGIGAGFAALALALPLHAQATLITDPAGDFVTGYLGPETPKYDVLSSEVFLNPINQTLTFTGTMAGPIQSDASGYYVWGVDRGAGVEAFNNNAPPGPIGIGVKFDSVIALAAAGTGIVNDIANGQTHNVTNVSINGSTISATVPLSDFPMLNIPNALTPEKYTWNLWPESQLQVKTMISDFAPDQGNAEVTVVPEPATALQALAGLVLGAILFGRARRRES